MEKTIAFSGAITSTTPKTERKKETKRDEETYNFEGEDQKSEEDGENNSAKDCFYNQPIEELSKRLHQVSGVCLQNAWLCG